MSGGESDWAKLVDDHEAKIIKETQALKITLPVAAEQISPESVNGVQSDVRKDPEDEKPRPEEASLVNKKLHYGLKAVRSDVEVLQKDPNSPLYSVKSFEDLNLTDLLLKGVYKMGYSRPSKIQETALPMLLADPASNMIAQSQSGTGKTAAFVLTMLSRVDPNKPYPQALCLSPTYELARQTGQVLESMGQYLIELSGLKVSYAVKGERVQRNAKITDHIIIGTPGTVLDWIYKLKVFDAEKLNIFVLDEADVMISQQGHQDQSTRIKGKLNPSCQMLLFSATYEPNVMHFASRIIPEAIVIRLRKEEESIENITQRYIYTETAEKKYEALSNMYGILTVGQSIVFCHTKKAASWLAEKMSTDGHAVALLTGELEIEQRVSILNRFREAKEKLLITTNLAARGIDIEQVNMVVNYDLPFDQQRRPDFETYLHRIGRTGRFGKRGLAINLVDGTKSEQMIKQIEKHFSRTIEKLDAENMDELQKLEDSTH